MQNVFFNQDNLIAEKSIIEELKIPSLVLMENAGRNSADFILSHFKLHTYRSIIIIAGKGNNAGDGFVIARYLIEKNHPVSLILVYDEKELKDDALINFNKLKNLNSDKLKISDLNNLQIHDFENSLIIDNIFGIGFKGYPDEKSKYIIDIINSVTSAAIVSVDIPSCLQQYNQESICVEADCTLSMGAYKFDTLFNKGKEASGNVNLIDIGVNFNDFKDRNLKKIFRLEKSDIKLQKRDANANKYTTGKVFVLAGSKGYTGAAYLCTTSAMRIGSGAVIIAYPESLDAIIEEKITEPVKLPLAETEDGGLSFDNFDTLKEKVEWSDCTLIGPGIGRNENTLSLVRKLVSDVKANYIIDADGIFAFKDNLELLKNSISKIILTPHTGEFANLLNLTSQDVVNDFYNLSKNFAKEYNVILVLKGAPTIITDGEYFYINSLGKENLASFGTGDVLSGIISGLFSQSKEAAQSAINGVLIHGYISEKLYNEFGSDSLMASDMLENLKTVKKEIGYNE
ncbi:MAG TPA: NAD(P)H-hydrate dehydratase [Ignavibacteria bacterium]|nr:NAD(P)H-hydrate dehydratase [Ignavibacteria bacterium]